MIEWKIMFIMKQVEMTMYSVDKRQIRFVMKAFLMEMTFKHSLRKRCGA